MSTRTDLELTVAWQAGDRSAGNELVRRHTRSVYNFLRNKVPERSLVDLQQEVFEECVGSIGRLREGDKFLPFLMGIAYHRLKDFYRKRSRKPDLVDAELLAFSVEDHGAGASTLVAKREHLQILLDSLRRLSMESQTVLELYYWEDMSGREIGEVLDVPEATVRGKIAAARKRLAEAIQTATAGKATLDGLEEELKAWIREVRDRFPENS